MKLRTVSMLTASMLLISVLTSCTSSEKVKKEDITLIVKTPAMNMECVSDPDITTAQEFLTKAGEEFSQQYTDANVTIQVKVFDYVNETEAVPDSFDTDMAADVLFEDYFNMSAYIYTGRVVPLDDMMTDSIKNDLDQTSLEMSMVEDRTYMMPYLSRQNIIIYNKTLMKQCGLEKYLTDDMSIQNWTTDQWTEILDTLAQNLPDGVYPAVMYGKNNQGDTHIMSLIRAFGSEIYDEDGNFNFEDEKAVQALSWIQEGVDRGWYPPHSENIEISDNQELFNNDQLVFYIFNNSNIPLYDDFDNYGFVNFPGSVATSFVTGFEIFDNGSEEKVNVAKDFLKYIYETDELLELSAGNISESNRVSEKYEGQIMLLEEFNDNADNVVDFMNNSPNWQGSESSVRSVFWPNIHDLLLKKTTPEECAAALDRDCNNALEIGRQSIKLHE